MIAMPALMVMFALLAPSGATSADQFLYQKEPTTGANAALTEEGYQAVVSLKSNHEMREFINRLLASDSREVSSEGELTGLVPFYSGVETAQTLAKLQEELSSKSWVRKMQEVPAAEASASTNANESSGTNGTAVHDAAANLTAAKSLKQAGTHPVQKLKAMVSNKGSAPAPTPQTSKSSSRHAVSPQATLPSVDSFLAKASEHLAAFNAQALAVQERVAEQQVASKARARAAWAAFRKNLTAQAEDTKAAQVVNAGLAREIKMLEKESEAVRRDANLLRSGNDVLRGTMMRLASKIGLTAEFLVSSLNATDDSEAPVLRVLAKEQPNQDLDFFLAQARQQLNSMSDAPAKPVAFVQVRGPKGDINYKAVEPLAARLEKLKDAQDAGLADLHEQFLALYEEGKQSYEKVMQTHEKLLARRTSMVELRQRLETANAHLQATRAQLQTRLRGTQRFASHVAGAMDEAMKHAKDALA